MDCSFTSFSPHFSGFFKIVIRRLSFFRKFPLLDTNSPIPIIPSQKKSRKILSKNYQMIFWKYDFFNLFTTNLKTNLIILFKPIFAGIWSFYKIISEFFFLMELAKNFFQKDMVGIGLKKWNSKWNSIEKSFWAFLA